MLRALFFKILFSQGKIASAKRLFFSYALKTIPYNISNLHTHKTKIKITTGGNLFHMAVPLYANDRLPYLVLTLGTKSLCCFLPKRPVTSTANEKVLCRYMMEKCYSQF